LHVSVIDASPNACTPAPLLPPTSAAVVKPTNELIRDLPSP